MPTANYSQPTPQVGLGLSIRRCHSLHLLTSRSLEQGAAFFDIAMEGDEVMNMPSGFTCAPVSGIQKQGLHCQDLSIAPATPSNWTEPVYLLGTYSNDIAFFEPMVSLSVCFCRYRTSLTHCGMTFSKQRQAWISSPRTEVHGITTISNTSVNPS